MKLLRKEYQLFLKGFYLPAAVLISSLFYFLSYSNYGFSNSDWGMIVMASERFLKGEVFYRDFSILYTPGIYIYTAIAFKIFGTSLLSATIAWSILRAFNCLLIYLIGIEFVSLRAALILPLLLWFVPGAIHKSFFVFFVLLNSLFLIKMLSSRGKGFYFLSGAVASITLFFRVDLFGFFVATFLIVEFLKVFWPWNKINGKSKIVIPLKNILLFSIGTIVTIAPFVLYLFSHSAINEAYRQTTEYTAAVRSVWFYLPPLSGIFSFDFLTLYKYTGLLLPFVFYFLFFVIIVSIFVAGDFKENDKKVLVLFLYGCMTLNQAIVHPGLGRVPLILPPILIANIYFIFRFYTTHNSRHTQKPHTMHFLPLASLNLVLIGFIIISCITSDVYLNGSISIRIMDTAFLSDPKLRVYAENKEAEEFNKTSDIIRSTTGNDEYIFTFPNNSQMFHFVTGRRNLEKYSNITEYLHSEERQKEVIKLLKEKKVRLIISELSETQKRDKWAPLLDKYIQEHYKPEQTVGNFSFLIRKDKIS